MGEDGEMLCFDAATAELERSIKVSDKEVIGLAHHPHRWEGGRALEGGNLAGVPCLLIFCWGGGV